MDSGSQDGHGINTKAWFAAGHFKVTIVMITTVHCRASDF